VSALTPVSETLELLSAAGTPASKVNVVILDLKAGASDIGPGELVEAWVFKVEDLAAVQAYQVMVLVEFGVEPGGRARMTSL
jgi:hypothetical protein